MPERRSGRRHEGFEACTRMPWICGLAQFHGKVLGRADAGYWVGGDGELWRSGFEGATIHRRGRWVRTPRPHSAIRPGYGRPRRQASRRDKRSVGQDKAETKSSVTAFPLPMTS